MSNIDLVTNGPDPFASFGQAAAPPQGMFLKFSKGEWLYGQDLIELTIGSRFAANMRGLRLGWRRWENKQVTEEHMHLLIDMVPMPSRASLGDTDEALWGVDADGKPQDPWTQTYELQLMSPSGELYIYGTSSHGGKRDLGNLSTVYATEYRQRPGKVPIITLGRDSYVHKTYGKTYVPVLKIVDWSDERVLSISQAGNTEEEDIPLDLPAPKPAPAGNAYAELKSKRVQQEAANAEGTRF